ncbi:GNAT family N-acetyltransferase [Modestobacter sp. NPDC049651]|uniref:GNAT family N-acetyltransferase n=1 Tax=unclassified Modestobacter TaxID=2643866 RepID=UPI00340CCDEF
MADLLVHLSTPGEWRAALDAGALRPPSLADAGFVHLSAPGQVHLPAERLFAGRRDVVLLVVDPARLTAPVRWEPGVPGDPAAMRFPHLYGELPVGAVVGVVPWRPDRTPELPAPGDAAARHRALAVSLPVRRAGTVVDVPGGFAVADPAWAASRDDNRALLTTPVEAGAVEDLLPRLAADLGWPAPAAALLHPEAGPVADVLAGRGWDVSAAVVMARWAPFPAAAGPAEVVAEREVHAVWQRSWRRELAGTPDLDQVVGQLVGREHRSDAVVRVLDVAVREAGQVVAAGQLRIDGATAAVESVLTDPAARGRGHGDAVLARCLELAGAAGCDLVVLQAAEEDWPRGWYARRGFAVVGRTWDVTRADGVRPGRPPTG